MLDIVYMWLWANAIKDLEGNLWITEKRVNFSEMGEDLPLSSSASKRRFLKLIDNKIISYNGDLKKYKIERYEENWLDFIDIRSLRYIWSIASELGTNICLYSLYRLQNTDPYGFAISVRDLRRALGMNLNNPTGNSTVIETFDSLRKLSLVRGESYQTGKITVLNITGAWDQNSLGKSS